MSYATAMLSQFDTNMALVTSEAVNPSGGGWKASGYRFAPEKEPDSAIEGLYYLDLSETQPIQRSFGVGENLWVGVVTVQLGFYRGGGDAGGGDRRSVTASANDECMRVADVLSNPSNYDSGTSGLRRVIYAGHRRAFDGKHGEIWEVRFDPVEWRQAVITS